MDERDDERIALFGMLEDERGNLVVANLHLTHLRDRDDLRAEQLKMVLDHPLMRLRSTIRIICGDLNTLHDGPVLRELMNESGYGNLQDAYVLGRGLSSRGTLHGSGSGPAGRCVDYLLSLADSPEEHPVFISSAVVLDRPDPQTGLLPSDHYGVATTLVPLRLGSWRRRGGRELVS